MREFRPDPDLSGALQPPNRYPPTAVGVETPEPPFGPASYHRAAVPRSFLRGALNLAIGLPVYGVVMAVSAMRSLVHRA